jgi:hypothetical protein
MSTTSFVNDSGRWLGSDAAAPHLRFGGGKAAAEAVPDIETAEVEAEDVDATVEEELAQGEGKTELPEEPASTGDAAARNVLEPTATPSGNLARARVSV